MAQKFPEKEYSDITAAAKVIAIEIIQAHNSHLPFHNDNHALQVLRRTRAILSAMGEASPKQQCLGAIAALFHDAVQNQYDNEARSAKIAVAFMQNVTIYATNEEGLPPPFDEADKTIIVAAIMATQTCLTDDHGTSFQPRLNPSSDAITRSLALADLGCAGMDGPNQFQIDGDALFREQNPRVLSIGGKLRPRPGFAGGERTDAMENECVATMIKWLKWQVNFAEGRKRLLTEELNGLPEPARSRVEELFNQFDPSIAAARDRVAWAEGKNFFQLGSAMGFTVV